MWCCEGRYVKKSKVAVIVKIDINQKHQFCNFVPKLTAATNQKAYAGSSAVVKKNASNMVVCGSRVSCYSVCRKKKKIVCTSFSKRFRVVTVVSKDD